MCLRSAINRSAPGDIILSRHNDATLTVEPCTHHRLGEPLDQVRKGTRWRVSSALLMLGQRYRQESELGLGSSGSRGPDMMRYGDFVDKVRLAGRHQATMRPTATN